MSGVTRLVLGVPDPAAAKAFYKAAFGLGRTLGFRETDEETSGFRAFTVSLVVSQPSTVDSLAGTAVDAGATVLKPAAKNLWGYGAVLQAPDGAIWKIATSKKKETGPATREVDEVVLLLGVADVKASKRFYVGQGLTVKRSFGGKYVEFEAAGGGVKLALYGRRALAKDAGVPADGTGSHRLAIAGADTGFTDPDGFAWEPAPASARRT